MVRYQIRARYPNTAVIGSAALECDGQQFSAFKCSVSQYTAYNDATLKNLISKSRQHKSVFLILDLGKHLKCLPRRDQTTRTAVYGAVIAAAA